MAREFDQLESQEDIRRRLGDYLPGRSVQGGPPPAVEQYKAHDRARVDPTADTFNQRWAPLDPMRGLLEQMEQQNRLRGTPVTPGTRERFLDPTKIISEASPPVPPTLNAPMPVIESGKNPAEQPYPAAVRSHVNTIEGVQRRGIVDPLTTLGAYVPPEFLNQALSTPAMAAPIAQWGRALERVKRSGVTPQTLSTFSVATRNLNNTLGVQVDPYAVLRGNPNG